MISGFAKTETFPDQIRLEQKQAGKWKNKRRWKVGYLVLTSYKLEKGKHFFVGQKPEVSFYLSFATLKFHGKTIQGTVGSLDNASYKLLTSGLRADG